MRGARPPAPIASDVLPEKTMNPRIASALGFALSVAAAALAAAAMTGTVRAESPLVDTPAYAGQRSVAEVRGETLAARRTLTSAGTEWVGQQDGGLPGSGLTRADARAAYIAARDEVHARDSEMGPGVMFWTRRASGASGASVMGAPPAR